MGVRLARLGHGLANLGVPGPQVVVGHLPGDIGRNRGALDGMDLVAQRMGVDMPFKGGAEALTSMMGGHVDMIVTADFGPMLAAVRPADDLHVEVQKVRHDSRVHLDIMARDIEAELVEGSFMAGLAAHYAARDIEVRILAAIRAAGLNPDERLSPEALGALDHVDEQTELDAPALDERHRLEQ